LPAGSFVRYIIETYGLIKLKLAYQLEARTDQEKSVNDTWRTAFGKPLAQLERDWVARVRARFP
jgi:hypothetical protein